MPEIAIKYDKEDIEKMTPDAKLNLLLEIAFTNHNTVDFHHKTLFGNGQEGLCDSVRSHKRGLKWLWSLFLLAGGGMLGLLFTHISGK